MIFPNSDYTPNNTNKRRDKTLEIIFCEQKVLILKILVYFFTNFIQTWYL